jgi:cell division protein FtsL
MNGFAMIEVFKSHFALILLIMLLMVTAIGVIYTKHTTRIAFVSLQKLEQYRDALNEEWGKLLLEQSTWATPSRIESQATKRLDMIVPAADSVVMVKP